MWRKSSTEDKTILMETQHRGNIRGSKVLYGAQFDKRFVKTEIWIKFFPTIVSEEPNAIYLQCFNLWNHSE